MMRNNQSRALNYIDSLRNKNLTQASYSSGLTTNRSSSSDIRQLGTYRPQVTNANQPSTNSQVSKLPALQQMVLQGDGKSRFSFGRTGTPNTTSSTIFGRNVGQNSIQNSPGLFNSPDQSQPRTVPSIYSTPIAQNTQVSSNIQNQSSINTNGNMNNTRSRSGIGGNSLNFGNAANRQNQGSNNIFGNTSNNSNGNMFSNNNNSNSSNNQNQTNIFGNNQNNNNSSSNRQQNMFGNNNSNNNQQNNIFGNNQNNSNSSNNFFGNSNQNNSNNSNNLFGNSNSNQRNNTSNNLFSNSNNNGAIFGNSNQNNSGNNLFGNNSNAQTNNLSSFNLFGNNQDNFFIGMYQFFTNFTKINQAICQKSQQQQKIKEQSYRHKFQKQKTWTQQAYELYTKQIDYPIKNEQRPTIIIVQEPRRLLNSNFSKNIQPFNQKTPSPQKYMQNSSYSNQSYQQNTIFNPTKSQIRYPEKTYGGLHSVRQQSVLGTRINRTQKTHKHTTKLQVKTLRFDHQVRLVLDLKIVWTDHKPQDSPQQSIYSQSYVIPFIDFTSEQGRKAFIAEIKKKHKIIRLDAKLKIQSCTRNIKNDGLIFLKGTVEQRLINIDPTYKIKFKSIRQGHIEELIIIKHEQATAIWQEPVPYQQLDFLNDQFLLNISIIQCKIQALNRAFRVVFDALPAYETASIVNDRNQTIDNFAQKLRNFNPNYELKHVYPNNQWLIKCAKFM